MRMGSSRAHFIDERGISNTQLFCLILGAVVFNFAGGYLIDLHAYLNADVIRLPGFVDVRIKEYVEFAPGSLNYFLASLISLLVFPPFYHILAKRRLLKPCEVSESALKEHPPLSSFQAIWSCSVSLALTFWVLFFGDLPGSGARVPSMSIMMIYPFLPVFMGLSSLLVGASYSTLFFSFFESHAK